MTIEKDTNSILLDEISFTQSSLFTPNSNESERNSGEADISDLNFSDSILLGKGDQSIEVHGIGNANEAKEVNITNGASKQIRLCDGKTVVLKRRIKKNDDIFIEHIKNDEAQSELDDLFKRANFRKTLKESAEKIKAAEGTKKQNQCQINTQVWTEKYKPTRFVQLCSAGNDRQYRLILHWLKKWSSIVFGEEIESNENVDSLGRPFKKFLLVNGPPGIGKTVAIQILARQLGYAVQELNAANSMDTLPQASNAGGNSYQNSNAALKLKIMNALTSNAITSNGKPSCLIIDEIDTSMNSNEIIKVLNELAQADRRTMSKKFQLESSEKENTKNKNGHKKKDFILNRPIICIANDIFATGSSRGGSPMDKLRPLCDIINLKKASFVKNAAGIKNGGGALRSVKEHLMRINENEKLGLDYQQIGEIVEICDADIRACINYLQFNGRKLDIPDYYIDRKGSSCSINMDSQLSWFAMVDMLFKRDSHLSKDENFSVVADILMNGSGKSAMSNSSTFDKVLKGCFNKYLDVVHLQDDSLVRPAELSDWLSFYDGMNGNMLQGSIDYYSSLVGMKIWSLFSEINPQKHINEKSLIPNARSLDFESYDLQKQNKTIIARLINKLPISTKLAIGGGLETNDSFATYFLPYLNKMITPDSAGSNKAKGVLPEFEKKIITNVSCIIKSFDLQMENHRDIETGQITMQISPDWSSITSFDNVMAPSPASVVLKQTQVKRQWLFPLIKSELERIEIIKRSVKRPVISKTEKNSKEEESSKRPKLSSSIEFFKGKYDGIASQIQDSTKRDSNHEATRIWVKYHEGFSNAVRKNIGWGDLWLS